MCFTRGQGRPPTMSKKKVKGNKSDGLVLSIDPGSNACGVSLWNDGNYVASTVLTSADSRDPYSRRLQNMLPQLSAFLTEQIGNQIINTVVSEGVRSRLVQVALGGILTESHVNANLSPTKTFVESMTWKSYARIHGATGPIADIKGLVALRETGWDFEKCPVTSEDAADSILIYLAWKTKV